jgi:hypothetical protein
LSQDACSCYHTTAGLWTRRQHPPLSNGCGALPPLAVSLPWQRAHDAPTRQQRLQRASFAVRNTKIVARGCCWIPCMLAWNQPRLLSYTSLRTLPPTPCNAGWLAPPSVRSLSLAPPFARSLPLLIMLGDLLLPSHALTLLAMLGGLLCVHCVQHLCVFHTHHYIIAPTTHHYNTYSCITIIRHCNTHLCITTPTYHNQRMPPVILCKACLYRLFFRASNI